MNTKKPIIFFGTEDFSTISLQQLIDDNFNIVGIITKPDSKKGRGQKIQPPKVKIIGEEYNIPVLQPQKMNEIIDFIHNFDKPAGVLVSFGRIIPQNIIDLFTPGIINVHPSLLPKYRGPSPIESAIFNGDSETGVSIMQLSAKMDAGPVYIQEKISLDDTITASQLYTLAGKMGARLLSSHLDAILNQNLLPEPQDEEETVYCQLLSKIDALLNSQTMTAQQAEQQIRAYEIFPKTKIEISGFLCIINEANVVDAKATPLDIEFKDSKYLRIKKLTALSGKQMNADSFINGYLK